MAKPVTERQRLERELARAEVASKKACEARGALPTGTSRARITTANARWMRAAEYRDRLRAKLDAMDEKEAVQG